MAVKVFALAAACLLAASAAHAQEIPSWIRDNAGYWADGVLDDVAFVGGISYLIGQGIMTVPDVEVAAAQGDGTIPAWIKNNASLWASGQIGDADFLAGMGYLVGAGVIDAGAADSGGGADLGLAGRRTNI